MKCNCSNCPKNCSKQRINYTYNPQPISWWGHQLVRSDKEYVRTNDTVVLQLEAKILTESSRKRLQEINNAALDREIFGE